MTCVNFVTWSTVKVQIDRFRKRQQLVTFFNVDLGFATDYKAHCDFFYLYIIVACGLFLRTRDQPIYIWLYLVAFLESLNRNLTA